MKMISIEKELKENSYPGRGIIVGRSEDGKKAAIAYFIMGRSSNFSSSSFGKGQIQLCNVYFKE